MAEEMRQSISRRLIHLTVLMTMDCCLSIQYTIPVELRKIISHYLVEALDDSNIHTAAEQWSTEETQQCAMLRYGPISFWDTSKVTDMSNLFSTACFFNDDISRWEVSEVITMNNMFFYALKFNQPLNTWQVDKVQDMYCMFHKAILFNQPLDRFPSIQWLIEKDRLEHGKCERYTWYVL
jgi:hypothetical protein